MLVCRKPVLVFGKEICKSAPGKTILSLLLKHKQQTFQFSDMANRLMLTFTLFAFLSATAVPLIEGMKCRIILDLSENWEKIHRDCFQSNPSNFSKFPMLNTTMEDFDFDDNCYYQCFYKGAGLLAPDGKLKKETKEAVSALWKKSELDAATLDKITAAFNECIEASEKIGKEKGFDECKLLSLHDFCFVKKLFGEKGLLEKKC